MWLMWFMGRKEKEEEGRMGDAQPIYAKRELHFEHVLIGM